MILGMVDDRALRLRQGASGRQPRPTPQPVQPTQDSRLNEVARVALGMNPFTGTSQANRDAATGFIQRHGAMDALLAPASSLVEDFADAGYAPSSAAGRFGLGAAAFGADVLNPVGWAAGGAIAKALGAAVPVARTAMGTTARTLSYNPRVSPGMQNVFELINARHASPNPNLGATLKHPRDVPVSFGRDWGPGFYYEAGRPLSSTVPYPDLLAKYGDTFYQPKMSPLDMIKIARSKGGADVRQDLGLEGVNRVSQMTIDDPVFRKAMEQGYTGAKGRTSWLVGNTDRVGGLPNLGVRKVTPADDKTYAGLEALLRRLFPN